METKQIIYKKLSLIFLLSLIISAAFAQEKLDNGSIAPDFKTTDNHNEKVELYKELAKGPVVLIFYRGEWCQYCNLYMFNLADSLSMITDLGAKVIAVTPESEEFIGEMVSNSNAKFSILYDKGHKIMDAYKVTWYVSKFQHFFYRLTGKNLKKASKNDDRALPVPATYIIGKDKKIVDGYFDKDYTKRMPVKDILEVLKKYNADS